MSFADELASISSENDNSIPNGLAKNVIDNFRATCKTAASNGVRSCEVIAMVGNRDIICEPNYDKHYSYRSAWGFDEHSYVADQFLAHYSVYAMDPSSFNDLKNLILNELSKDGFSSLRVVEEAFDILITTPKKSYSGFFDFVGHDEGGRLGYNRPTKVKRNRIIIRATW